LRGQKLTPGLIADAAQATGDIHIESDSRGSADYKAHLLKVHLARALQDLSE
jgi:CO/xanthine dehydrogenase FAD-binding subunit